MYGFVITTAGEGLLARASAGEGLTLTEVWVGKGAVESAEAAKALTALLDPVAKATSTTPAVAGGQISMLVEYRNDMGGGLEEGFTLSEFGVMAKVGDDAPALLYYAALGDRAQPVPPIAEGLDVHRFPVAVGVTGEVEVSLEYPAGVWVTHEELEEALAGIDLSGYIKATEKGRAGGVATLGQDGKLVQDVDGGNWDTDPVETHNGAAWHTPTCGWTGTARRRRTPPPRWRSTCLIPWPTRIL